MFLLMWTRNEDGGRTFQLDISLFLGRMGTFRNQREILFNIQTLKVLIPVDKMMSETEIEMTKHTTCNFVFMTSQ